MTELRNVEADLARFRVRVLVASIVVVVCLLLLALGVAVVGAEEVPEPERWKTPQPAPNPVTSQALRINHSREAVFILTPKRLAAGMSIFFG